MTCPPAPGNGLLPVNELTYFVIVKKLRQSCRYHATEVKVTYNYAQEYSQTVNNCQHSNAEFTKKTIFRLILIYPLI